MILQSYLSSVSIFFSSKIGKKFISKYIIKKFYYPYTALIKFYKVAREKSRRRMTRTFEFELFTIFFHCCSLCSEEIEKCVCSNSVNAINFVVVIQRFRIQHDKHFRGLSYFSIFSQAFKLLKIPIKHLPVFPAKKVQYCRLILFIYSFIHYSSPFN